jgi:hypothetical protein
MKAGLIDCDKVSENGRLARSVDRLPPTFRMGVIKKDPATTIDWPLVSTKVAPGLIARVLANISPSALCKILHDRSLVSSAVVERTVGFALCERIVLASRVRIEVALRSEKEYWLITVH